MTSARVKMFARCLSAPGRASAALRGGDAFPPPPSPVPVSSAGRQSTRPSTCGAGIPPGAALRRPHSAQGQRARRSRHAPKRRPATRARRAAFPEAAPFPSDLQKPYYQTAERPRLSTRALKRQAGASRLKEKPKFTRRGYQRRGTRATPPHSGFTGWRPPHRAMSNIRQRVRAFLDGAERVLALVGPSGTGKLLKTEHAARDADRLCCT